MYRCVMVYLLTNSTCLVATFHLLRTSNQTQKIIFAGSLLLYTCSLQAKLPEENLYFSKNQCHKFLYCQNLSLSGISVVPTRKVHYSAMLVLRKFLWRNIS